jgi:alcohol dehydrogenase
MGATAVVDASSSDPVDAVLELVPGGVDHAFEALGRPETIETAMSLTGRGGQALLIGMAPPDARVPFDALTMTLEERSVRGSWYGSCVPLRDIPLLVELYRSGRCDGLIAVGGGSAIDCAKGVAIAATHDGHIQRPVEDLGREEHLLEPGGQLGRVRVGGQRRGRYG